MNSYENKFDPLIHELLTQKQVFEALVAENQELHRQLTELRAGRGCFLEICGNRFALGEANQNTVQALSQGRLTSEPRPVQQTVQLPTVVPAPAHSNRAETEAASPQTPASLEAVHFAQASLAATETLPAVPAQPSPSSQPQREEQASLKRELQGSFLLE